jgi:hypothetical protein
MSSGTWAQEPHLTSYSNISNHIIVGSGHNISVIGHQNALLPNFQTPLINFESCPTRT